MYTYEGVSIRKIMLLTGYDYETIKKYLDKEDFSALHNPPKEAIICVHLYQCRFEESQSHETSPNGNALLNTL